MRFLIFLPQKKINIKKIIDKVDWTMRRRGCPKKQLLGGSTWTQTKNHNSHKKILHKTQAKSQIHRCLAKSSISLTKAIQHKKNQVQTGNKWYSPGIL